jgi:hypothetical protein
MFKKWPHSSNITSRDKQATDRILYPHPIIKDAYKKIFYNLRQKISLERLSCLEDLISSLEEACTGVREDGRIGDNNCWPGSDHITTSFLSQKRIICFFYSPHFSGHSSHLYLTYLPRRYTHTVGQLQATVSWFCLSLPSSRSDIMSAYVQCSYFTYFYT